MSIQAKTELFVSVKLLLLKVSLLKTSYKFLMSQGLRVFAGITFFMMLVLVGTLLLLPTTYPRGESIVGIAIWSLLGSDGLERAHHIGADSTTYIVWIRNIKVFIADDGYLYFSTTASLRTEQIQTNVDSVARAFISFEIREGGTFAPLERVLKANVKFRDLSESKFATLKTRNRIELLDGFRAFLIQHSPQDTHWAWNRGFDAIESTPISKDYIKFESVVSLPWGYVFNSVIAFQTLLLLIFCCRTISLFLTQWEMWMLKNEVCCSSCGYPLKGLKIKTPCPECGCKLRDGPGN